MSFPAYPDYKHSGIELLPEYPSHWALKRFKNVFEERAERSSDGSEELLSVSAYFGVKPRSETLDEGDHLSRAESLEGYKVCRAGDLVINIMLAWNRGLGFSWQHGIVSPAYSVFHVTDGSYPKFLDYLVRSDEYIRYFKTHSAGIMDSRLRLYPESFGRLFSVIPPACEQTQIARFLDHETARIDALIEEQQRLIELLKEKRQAVISHAVTKGLDPTAPMKDSGVEWLGEVPAHWQVKRLKHLVPSITVGIVVEPSKYYVDDGVPALRSLNVKPGAVVAENLVYLSEESNELHAKSKILEGDIVAVRSGQPGTAAIVPLEFNGANCIDLIVIRKPLQGCSTFIFWYLNSDAALKQFSEGTSGAIQQHFNIAAASEMLFAWPPASEQLEINSHLDRACHQLDRLISVAGESKSLLLERRSALISAAVTGKIDVRDWQPPASTQAPKLEVAEAD